MSMPETNGRELTFGDAIKEALAEELRRDPRCLCWGKISPKQAQPSKC